MSGLLGKYEKWMRGNYLWTGVNRSKGGLEKLVWGFDV